MQRKTILISAATAVLLAAALAWAFAPRPIAVEMASASRGAFEVHIDEDAKTRLAERYTVAAPLAGRLARITLREGDRVDAGATVAQLSPMLPALLDERSQRELRARLEAAQAALQRADARVARAQTGLEQATTELRRSEQLAQQGFIAPTQLDNQRLAARGAQQEQRTAQEERHMASHEIEQARAALASTADRRGGTGSSFAVRSPIRGQVLRVLQASEGSVAVGTPLLELGDTGRMEVVAELLTTDALAARPGSAVHIERWGGPQPLQGVVARVEPAAFTKVSALGVEEQRVRVLIEITSPREQWQALGDGYRVGVRIVTLQQADALQVPLGAVFPRPGAATPNETAVFVLDGHRARLQPVTLGARNSRSAWLSGGLQAGQAVIVYPPAGLSDGARVQLRPRS